jgi:hypothetical protein
MNVCAAKSDGNTSAIALALPKGRGVKVPSEVSAA